MSNAKASAMPVRPRLILVIDDDEQMRALYRSLFRRHSGEFACEIKETGEAGLSFLSRTSVDAVILDWDLPGVKGREVLKAIRAHPSTAALPVLVATGGDPEISRPQALRCGASGFLAKPFLVQEFMASLRGLFK